jgi:hypothetical protein
MRLSHVRCFFLSPLTRLSRSNSIGRLMALGHFLFKNDDVRTLSCDSTRPVAFKGLCSYCTPLFPDRRASW